MDTAFIETETPLALPPTEPPAPAKPAQVLYDADAPQRVEMRVTRRTKEGPKKYRVAHLLRAVEDEQFFGFEDSRKTRVVVTQKPKDRSGEVFEQRNSDEDAYCHLWDLVATGREGYKERPDWKEATARDDKIASLRDGLFYFELEDEQNGYEAQEMAELLDDAPDEEAEEFADELLDDDDGEVFSFRAAFNGKAVTVRHYCRRLTAAEQRDFEKLTKKGNFNQRGAKNQIVRHLPSKAREICAYYPLICQRSEGYAGRVPAWHQLYVVLAVAAREQEVVRGN